MDRYNQIVKQIEDALGNKDNVLSIATIALDKNADGKAIPYVRNVDAFYENETFYITTYELSKKMKQIEQNNEVAFSTGFEGITGNGIAENLGWVKDPKNAEIREKLRKVFAEWYDAANNEDDKNCVILAIHITKCYIFWEHGAVQYNIDVVNKKEF